MLRFLRIVSLFACSFMSIAVAQADTLDFSSFIPANNPPFFIDVEQTEINLGNAILRSSFDKFVVGSFPSNGFGAICAATPNLGNGSTCSGNMEIEFAQSVTGLTLNVGSYDVLDSELTFQAFASGVLVGEFNPERGQNVFVDLSGFGVFDRLLVTYADMLSSGAHLNDFAFETVSVVPLPAALPLFGVALLGLGYVGRSRRKNSRS